MPLPLNDSSNILYELTPLERLKHIINWQQAQIKPAGLFSLAPGYDQNAVNKAYRQLAVLSHPDKWSEHKDLAESAFKIVCAANEYLSFYLKSVVEQKNQFELIKNNIFYLAYDSSPAVKTSFMQKKTEHSSRPSFFDIQAMQMAELSLNDLIKKYREPGYKINIINELKRRILKNKALLTEPYAGLSQIILFVAVEGNDLDFIEWLISQGANPFLRIEYSGGCFDNAVGYAVELNRHQVVKYLVQRYGHVEFFDKADDGASLTPQWWRLESLILSERHELIDLFLNSVGYAQYPKVVKFDRFISSILTPEGDHTPTISLLLEHDLLANLPGAINDAMQKNNIKMAQYIYSKLPAGVTLDMSEIWNAYKEFTYINDELAIEWMLKLLQAQPLNATLLDSMLLDLNDMLHAPNTFRGISHIDSIDRINRRVAALALIPKVFSLFHAVQLSDTTAVAQDISQEKQQRMLQILTSIVEKGTAAILTELLAITDAPLNNLKNHVHFPLYTALFLSLNPFAIEASDMATLLINQGGSQLIQTARDCLLKYKDMEYEYYNPLHLACELGLRKHGLHLITRMREQGFDLDAVAHRKEHHDARGQFTRCHYSSLHIAIANCKEELALALIDGGADYKLKAVIERPSSYFGFFAHIEKKEKSPLAMALELRRPKVVRALQLKLLDEYIAQRQQEDEYLSHITLFGYTLFRFGYFSKSKKLDDARAFRALVNQGGPTKQEFDLIRQGALDQGRLGEIAQLSHHCCT